MRKRQMPKFERFPILFGLFAGFIPGLLLSQGGTNIELAKQILLNSDFSKISKKNSAELRLQDNYITKSTGIEHYFFIQLYDGIEIQGSQSAIHLDQDGKPVRIYDQFADVSAVSFVSPEHKLTPEKALASAVELMEYKDLPEILPESNNDEKKFRPALSYRVGENGFATAQLKYIRQDETSFRLCWEILMEEYQSGDWWLISLDAGTGDIFEKQLTTLHCQPKLPENLKPRKTSGSIPKSNLPAFLNGSYFVFELGIESPLEGMRSLVVEPWMSALNASPYGWHDTDGVDGSEYSFTRGNNVYASEDRDGDFNHGNAPDGGEELVFDYALNLDSFPEEYTEASITNLFYWTNVLHDALYQYGFDEVSGNFQENNYGKGGSGGDYVDAFCQEGSGINNASFTTFPDGKSPRMQMMEYEAKQIQFDIKMPAPISGTYYAADAKFGPVDVTITGNIVQVVPADGCNSLTNPEELNGKIALIERGTCFFIDKVLHAQQAGAIGAIICNNEEGAPFPMEAGGPVNPAIIEIPSVMLKDSDCQEIKIYLPEANASIKIEELPNLDSSLDNGVVIHEYAHGLSNRLTGGPSNSGCLNNEEQMGEGWSDWFAKIFTMKPEDKANDSQEIGSYLRGTGNDLGGFRKFPYTVDLNLNAQTYGDIKDTGSAHELGEIWSAMLWDMTWALIEEFGFDPDIYHGTGGNNLAIQLVIDGMKLQPCRPGFVEARNAILLADSLINEGANDCLIWESFAKRGLGLSADQGSRFDKTDGIEAFDIPEHCPVDCPENLIVDILDQTSYFAEQQIISTVKAGVLPLIFQAGQEILLSPGFTWEGEHTFEMRIAPCTSISKN